MTKTLMAFGGLLGVARVAGVDIGGLEQDAARARVRRELDAVVRG